MIALRGFVAIAGAGAVMLLSPAANALPGTHPDAVSTFDTRGSTVVLAYRQGVVFDGTSRVFSYNANFTATSGNFSAQFGVHYLQLKLAPDDLMMHGAAANGTALFSIPLSKRHPNGVPVTALDLYLGVVPTAAISGPVNFMSVPANIGVGVSVSPVGWFTLTPWFEAAPSVNLDTEISDLDFTVALRENVESADLTEADEITVLTREDINQVLQESVDLQFSTHLALRGGVTGVIHLGPTWDLNLYTMATTFGSTFDGQFIAQAGIGLSFHWDDVVPEVLPAEQRLQQERCEDIERRFQACPAYRRLRQSTSADAPQVPPASSTVPSSAAPRSSTAPSSSTEPARSTAAPPSAAPTRRQPAGSNADPPAGPKPAPRPLLDPTLPPPPPAAPPAP